MTLRGLLFWAVLVVGLLVVFVLVAEAKAENWVGTSANNVHYGSQSGDWLQGRGGHDRLYGLGGPDDLDGNGGNDRLSGNAGDDYLWGMGGRDRIHAGTGYDVCKGGSGADLFIDCELILDFHAWEGDEAGGVGP